MGQHYPGSAWLYLRDDVFERLYAYRRRQGLSDWNDVMTRLISAADGLERGCAGRGDISEGGSGFTPARTTVESGAVGQESKPREATV